MNDQPERRRRGTFRWIALALGLSLVTVACVSFQSSVSGTVSDAQGKAVSDVLVVYTYEGKNYAGLVHATGYRRSGGVVRSDAAGKLEIGSRILFTQPLVGGIRPMVLAVYSPTGRNGVEYQGGFDIQLPAGAGPREWFLSLEAFYQAVVYGVGEGWLDLDRGEHAELRQFITSECKRFWTVHGAPNRGNASPWSESVLQLLELNKANPIR